VRASYLKGGGQGAMPHRLDRGTTDNKRQIYGGGRGINTGPFNDMPRAANLPLETGNPRERGTRPKTSLVQLDKYEGSGNGLCTKGRIGYKYKNETHKPQSES
jgi:hypothetical protein